MTRKDYILLANVLRIARNNASPATQGDLSLFVIDQLTEDLCSELKRDNPRFNREHFLAVVKGLKGLQSRPSRNSIRAALESVADTYVESQKEQR
jgi:hypothetical protein